MAITGKFKIDVYQCHVYIKVCKSVKSSVNYYLAKNNFKLHDCEPAGMFCNPLSDERIGSYYIFLNQEDGLNVEVVNHEKSHLVEQILLDRGIKPIDEVRSYLDGYVSQMIDLFFKKRKIKLKNKRL